MHNQKPFFILKGRS